MKKLALATLVISGIIFLGFNTAEAESHHKKDKKMSEKCGMKGMHGKMMEKKGDMHCKMMKDHMSKKGMEGKSGMMMGGMMQKKQVVPTKDGGVVVVIGNKLYKYNKKLEKIGETTVEMSEEDMEKRMKHMKKMREKCMNMWNEEEEEENEE